MKGIFRQFISALLSLYITSQIFSGLVIKGGFPGLLYAALLLTIGFVIIKPVLKVITLPLSIITLGLFSALIILFIMFILTKVDPSISITSFTFKGFSIISFSVPTFKANILLSYILISATIQLVYKFLTYLFEQ